MSRGLGVIQREMLTAIDEGAGAWGVWVPVAGGGHRGQDYLRTPDHVFSVKKLQRHLASAKPEERADCHGDAHCGFRPVFSRALHSLIRRGLLVPVMPQPRGGWTGTAPSSLDAYEFVDTDQGKRVRWNQDRTDLRLIRPAPVRFVRYADSRPGGDGSGLPRRVVTIRV